MRRPFVTVVMAVHQKWELTRACLARLRETTPGSICQVVVVDNASTDETPRDCYTLGKTLFGGRFSYLRQEENLNFGPATNLGADQAQGEYLLLLNNDTLPHPGWLEPLARAFRQDDRLGAAGPLLTYPEVPGDGGARVQHAGICFDLAMRPLHVFEQFPAEHPAVKRTGNPQAVTAAAMLLPRELFRSLDGFHPAYANGYEDMDLCCQLRRAGKRLAVIPESRITHIAGQSPGRFDREDVNAEIFRRRASGCFSVDLHTVADRNGYRVRLTPWQASCLRLPRQRERDLDLEYAVAEDPAELARALRAEPLWRGGYERLAELRVREGDLRGVVRARFLQVFFCPDLPGLETLRQSAVAAGDTAMVRECQGRIAAVHKLLADPEKLTDRARDIRDRAVQAGQKGLAGVYTEWLAAYAD